MKNKTYIIMYSVLSLSTFASCVQDDLYNTPHPEQGKITLVTDWTDRTSGLDIPASYTVAVGNYSATLSGATNSIDNLFDPGTYHISLYNTPQHITLSGTTATVAPASGNVSGVGTFVQELPGWLFTGALDATIEADTDHELTATMHQQVRQLTLFVEPTGDTTKEIAQIEGYLSGVASTLDIAQGTHSTPQNVALVFTRVTNGENAGKWAATVRLLGIAGEQQKLNALITFTDNNPKPLSFDSDLSTSLRDFNTDKKTPLALGGRVVETPTSAGTTGSIIDWTVQEETDITVN